METSWKPIPENFFEFAKDGEIYIFKNTEYIDRNHFIFAENNKTFFVDSIVTLKHFSAKTVLKRFTHYICLS